MNAPLVLPDGVQRVLIMNDPVDLAVPADHPLAGRASVELTELSAEPWITWPYGAICHEWLTQTLRQHGLTPEVTHTAEEHQTQLAMVAAGLGIAVMPRLGRGSIEGVSIITLKPSLLASDLRHLQDSGVGTTGHRGDRVGHARGRAEAR